MKTIDRFILMLIFLMTLSLFLSNVFAQKLEWPKPNCKSTHPDGVFQDRGVTCDKEKILSTKIWFNGEMVYALGAVEDGYAATWMSGILCKETEMYAVINLTDSIVYAHKAKAVRIYKKLTASK